MMIEKTYASPCYELFNNCFFQSFGRPVPIDYFTCHHGISLFVIVTELINHFSVHQHPKTNDDVNR